MAPVFAGCERCTIRLVRYSITRQSNRAPSPRRCPQPLRFHATTNSFWIALRRRLAPCRLMICWTGCARTACARRRRFIGRSSGLARMAWCTSWKARTPMLLVLTLLAAADNTAQRRRRFSFCVMAAEVSKRSTEQAFVAMSKDLQVHLGSRRKARVLRYMDAALIANLLKLEFPRSHRCQAACAKTAGQ